jgi:putative tricarboxylic transport membrane protein
MKWTRASHPALGGASQSSGQEMSQEVHASSGTPHRGMKISNPRDFYGGLGLVLLGLIALWASRDLSGMNGFAFGPGTAPRMFAVILIALGVAIMAVGWFTEGVPLERYEISAPALFSLSYMFAASARTTAIWIVAAALLVGGIILAVVGMMGPRRALVRGPLFITLSIIVFAVAIRPLGLVLASYLSIVAAAAATPEARWIETLIWGAVLTAFCVLLFVFGLNLPFQLWPTNLSWETLFSLR